MKLERKICFVIYSLSGGGAEKVVGMLSAALAGSHNVSVVVFDARDISYSHGGELIDLKLPSAGGGAGSLWVALKRISALRDLQRSRDFDDVITFMESSSFPSILAGLRPIVSVRNDVKSMKPYIRWLMRAFYPFAKIVVSCSRENELSLKRVIGLRNTCTIRNPVTLFDAESYDSQKISQRPYFLAVGRLVKQKGFDLLIDAYANSDTRSSFDLVILGEGCERSVLENKIENLGMSKFVHLPGRIVNPGKYYENAYAFVLSSRHEGFPNVLIEALSYGLPCVAFDCPTGPSEIIEHEYSGLLVPEGDTEILAAELNRLCVDTSLVDTLRSNSRTAVRELTIDSIKQEWECLFV